MSIVKIIYKHTPGAEGILYECLPTGGYIRGGIIITNSHTWDRVVEIFKTTVDQSKCTFIQDKPINKEYWL